WTGVRLMGGHESNSVRYLFKRILRNLNILGGEKMENLDLLFSPKRIRNVEIKNRIAVSAHATALNPNSYPSDQFIQYNVAKARGGVGLLMTMGSASTHPTSPNSDWGGIHLWDDDVIPHLKKMSEAIKPYGT